MESLLVEPRLDGGPVVVMTGLPLLVVICLVSYHSILWRSHTRWSTTLQKRSSPVERIEY
jgi:hypothetical protein